MAKSQPEPLIDSVYAQIRDLILSNVLRAGQKLIDRDLAEQLGVSRPPVRDALKQLIFSGYLETRGNATYVKSITEKLLPDPLKEQIFQSGRW